VRLPDRTFFVRIKDKGERIKLGKEVGREPANKKIAAPQYDHRNHENFAAIMFPGPSKPTKTRSRTRINEPQKTHNFSRKPQFFNAAPLSRPAPPLPPPKIQPPLI